MGDKSQLEEKIKKKEAELQRLIAERDYLLRINPEEEAARMLAYIRGYDEAWGYEMKDGFIDDWTRESYEKALGKVRKIKGLGVSVHDLIKVLQVLIER